MVADMSVLRRCALEHLTPPKHWRSRAITFENPPTLPERGVHCVSCLASWSFVRTPHGHWSFVRGGPKSVLPPVPGRASRVKKREASFASCQRHIFSIDFIFRFWYSVVLSAGIARWLYMCVDCTMTFIYDLIAPKLGSLSGFEISLDGGVKIFERAV